MTHGFGVGVGVGSAVGTGVGAAVGRVVGATVGRGVAVGAAVGAVVGVGVAAGVGVGVAVAVGAGVRVAAGDGVAVAGGLEVGRAVGEGDGDGVAPGGVASIAGSIAGPTSTEVVAPGVGEPVEVGVPVTVGPAGRSVTDGEPGSALGGVPSGSTTTRSGIPGPGDGGTIERNARATTIAMTSPKTMPMRVWRYMGSSDRMRHLPRRSKRADPPGAALTRVRQSPGVGSPTGPPWWCVAAPPTHPSAGHRATRPEAGRRQRLEGTALRAAQPRPGILPE